MLAGMYFDSVATTGATGLAQTVIDLLTLILDPPGRRTPRRRADPLADGSAQRTGPARAVRWWARTAWLFAGIIGATWSVRLPKPTATASADCTGVDVFGLSLRGP